jgi:hypothetical protein
MKSKFTQPSDLLPVHSPVRRLYADRYLLITLISFAASVTLTRLFLNLTGFPQLGGGELHIAHMLWGGLLLFAATLFPLTLANRWALDISAFLSGIGVGLFIDEVGKFITQQNNYFFPAAAPIIYALFLMTLMLYSLVRRKGRPDQRRNIFLALEHLEDVADHDLTDREKHVIMELLKENPGEKLNPELSALANSLAKYLRSHHIRLAAEKPSWWQKIENGWLAFESGKFGRSRHRFFMAAGILLWGGWAIAHALLSWQLSLNQVPLPGLASELINNHLPLTTSGFGLPELRIVLELMVGGLLLVSFLLLLIRKEKRAVQLSASALLFSISVVYLLVFYFEQFSSIFYAFIQFTLLMMILRYRVRFLNNLN